MNVLTAIVGLETKSGGQRASFQRRKPTTSLADEMLFVGVAFELLPAVEELNIGGAAMKGHGAWTTR